MTKSYRKMLFDNPGYKFTNVSKFLGEVSTDHTMAKVNLKEIEDNLGAFATAISQLMMDVPAVEGILAELKYPMKRLGQLLESPVESGLTDKDACIFVHYMLYCYEELAEMANEIDSEMKA